MTTTASGFYHPAVGSTAGEFQDLKDMADASEAVVSVQRAIKSFRAADAGTRDALLVTYAATLLEGDLCRQTDTEVTYRFNGSAWKLWESDWIAFTSTLTNITVGTGGSQALKYKYEFGRCHVHGPIILGSSGFSVGTGPTMTLPVTAATPPHAYQAYDGKTYLYDVTGIASAMGHITASNLSTTIAIIWSTASTVGNMANVTATAPFTWAAGDTFDIDFFFEPA